MRRRRRLLSVAALLAAVALPTLGGAQRPDRTLPVTKDPGGPPPVARELRAVWVTAVSNLDWPSRPGLPTDTQKAELIAILDRAVALGMNAIVLQVRPAADALYRSSREPWSTYLTGRQGRAPAPAWDPLAFAVAEAHARGLELHAWFNPFRAFHRSAPSGDTAATHVVRTNPSMVRAYGGDVWMNPGNAAVRERSLAVIADVVRRYDIDAVHLDDYFYPYRVDTRRGYVQFPDASTYAAYRRAGGRLARDDWRRENVNTFVRELYTRVHAIKPHVRVGISPFGIWRPGFPSGITGLDAYQEIYADSRLWLRRGWVDYFAPQLYWHPDAERQSFSRLLAWWGAAEQNPHGRHIWPGLYTNRVIPGETNPRWRTEAVVRQIVMARDDAVASGHIHFSMRALQLDVDGIASRLQASLYREPSLVPATPWLDRSVPPAPAARVVQDPAGGGALLELTPAAGSAAWLWTVQWRDASGHWRARVVPGSVRRTAVADLTQGFVPDLLWVTAVNRVGTQSDLVVAPLGAAVQ